MLTIAADPKHMPTEVSRVCDPPTLKATTTRKRDRGWSVLLKEQPED
jgi:hypothetical protein